MMQAELMSVLLGPIVSEKSTRLAERDHHITFRVRKSANKSQVKRAVEWLFKVEVEMVQILNMKGKAKRFGRFMGSRSDWKKAYVKLKPGFEIDFTVS